MHIVYFPLTSKEWDEIRALKKRMGFTWRGVIIDWFNKTK